MYGNLFLNHMKRVVILFTLSFSINLLWSQVKYHEFQSVKLGAARELKIQLPRNYNPDSNTTYPLVIVLDGDYLFEPLSGNIDYQSYWGDMPGCIVVGVNQNNTRNSDFYLDQNTLFPVEQGARFFEFLGMELIPYINNKYKTSDFRMIVGHDQSANFINYYLFKDAPLFKAYVVMSPALVPEMQNRLVQRLPNLSADTFYYLATAENDAKQLKEKIEALNVALTTVDNPKLHYKFDSFNEANHYSLVGLALPKALDYFFNKYKPVSLKEYNEKMLEYPEGPYQYIVKKYEDMALYYGFEKKIVEIDLRAVAAAANKKDDIEAFKNLAKLAKKEYPDSMISAYYQGLYFEKQGNLKKALQLYQSGLLLTPSDYIDKDVLLDKSYDIKGAY